MWNHNLGHLSQKDDRNHKIIKPPKEIYYEMFFSLGNVKLNIHVSRVESALVNLIVNLTEQKEMKSQRKKRNSYKILMIER